jgi:hypothetical protein
MNTDVTVAPISADGSNPEQAFDLPTKLLAFIGPCDAIAQTPNGVEQ